MFTALIVRFTHEAITFLGALGRYLVALGQGIDEARATAHRFQSLARMSDAELASHGLKREDIARAAFAQNWP